MEKLLNLSGENDDVQLSWYRRAFLAYTSFFYHVVYIICVLIFGTMLGTIAAIFLPIGFPVMMLYQRYKPESWKRKKEADKKDE